MCKKNDKEDSKAPKLRYLFIALGLVGLICWLNWYLVDTYTHTKATSAMTANSTEMVTTWTSLRGTFGDMFGAANALFSGFAFAGVAYAIWMQTHEMREQEKESKQLRFESTFFELLKLQHQIVDAIDLRPMKRQQYLSNPLNNTIQSQSPESREPFATSRDCFKHFYDDLTKRFDNDNDNINTIYQAFYKARQADIGHYFRNLYQIVKLIDQPGVEDKQRYIDILCAQLSTYEMLLLFYNGLSSLGSKNFKPLIETHKMFDNLVLSELIKSEHKCLYKKTAYGKQQEEIKDCPNQES